MTEKVDGPGGAATAEGGASAPGPRRKRRALRVAALTASALVLVAACAVAAAYEHLNANIHGAPLYSGATGNPGSETPDAFGRTPINVLVIGSDTRGSADDCKLGGDCGPGANADVEMVVHISADRSNATVMSVPRDTVTDLPGCTDPRGGTSTAAHRDQINGTLQYGPGCTVAAVHQLTGIPIDHFMMVDFAGVVNMSDAVGGVDVCVDANVYDPYSHLKLARGTHNLKGTAALQFVRSRHGFGDGSDLGRTYAQHLYLSALLRMLKSAGTLADPTAVYPLADAATKALTVDNDLDSIPKLLGLATDLDKVPAARTTFTTMQNLPDPQDSDRVVVAPAARSLFDAIIADRSLTPSASASASASVPAPASGAASASGAAPDPTATTPSATTATPSDSATDTGPTTAPTADAHPQTADQDHTCAQVSTYRTVALNGVPMTPVEAFAASPDIPVSAP